jgi:hypothetical protein
MSAAVVSGGNCAIGLRSTQQWFSRRSEYILAGAVLCGAVLGGGVFQPCQSSTMYHYTGNPLLTTLCSPFASTADCAPGNITVDFTIDSNNTTINTENLPPTSHSFTIESRGISAPSSNGAGNDGGFANIVNGTFVSWAFANSTSTSNRDYHFETSAGRSAGLGTSGFDRFIVSSGTLTLYDGLTSTPGTWTSVSSPPLTPTFDVKRGWTVSPSGGDDALVALATATDQTGLITLGQAAQEFGVDHFNWIQYVKEAPTLAVCKGKSFSAVDTSCNALTDITGKVPATPTLDPPLGGWEYQKTWNGRNNSFPSADFNPFYYDEYFPSRVSLGTGPSYKDSQLLTSTLPDVPDEMPAFIASLPALQTDSVDLASGFLFDDMPHSSNPGTIKFVDFLVGRLIPLSQVGQYVV